MTEISTELIKQVRDWLDDPNHWTQGTYLRVYEEDMFEDVNELQGEEVVKRIKEVEGATCLAGAFIKFNGWDDPIHAEVDVWELIKDFVPEDWAGYANYTSVPDFNDNVNHDDVLGVLDEVINYREHVAEFKEQPLD